MEIKKSHSNKKITIIVVVALLLVGVVVATWYFTASTQSDNNTARQGANYSDNPDVNTINYNPPTEEEKQLGQQAKENFLNKQKGEENNVPEGTSSISITNVSQQDSTLRVRTTIQASRATDSCELTLSRQGEADIVREVGVQDYGSYSVCRGFDIDTSDLQKGTWMIKLHYSGDKEGVYASRSVELGK